MNIIHRLTVGDEPERRERLSSLGVKFGASDSPLASLLWFDLDESDPTWNEVCSLIAKWKAQDGGDPNNLGFVHTEFSKKECDEASFYQILAGQSGYPQPEGGFGFRKMTYDLSDYCPRCGIGAKQVAPFRMKTEPKWRTRCFLQLNWVHDAVFILPDVWKEVFEPLGVGCSPVIEHRSGKALRTVVQLDVKNVAASALSLTGYASETCEDCGRKKYLPISRGFFPAFVVDPGSKLCKTQEYFGSGASGWNAIVAVNELYRAVQDRKLEGIRFVPLSPA